MDSLSGGAGEMVKVSGEMVKVSGESKVDVACVQEIRWMGSGRRFFGAVVKRPKLFVVDVRRELKVWMYL